MSIFLLFAVVLFLCLVGCNATERDYYDDIIFPLHDSSEKIIIKEWSWLQGSGAEIYYHKDDASPILLGKTTGTDDGFCPFQEGLYEITQRNRSVTIKWCVDPSEVDKDNWRSKTFELP